MALEKPKLNQPDDPLDVGKRPKFDGSTVVWEAIAAGEVTGLGSAATRNLTVGATAPASPAVGDVWVDTTAIAASGGGGDVIDAVPIPAGRWLLNTATAAGTVAMTAGQRYWIPMPVPLATNIDRIGAEVTAGAASAICRIGLYSSTGNLPGSLVVDGGTVDCSTTGEKTVTVSQSLSRGLYWVCCWFTGGAPTMRVMVNTAGPTYYSFPNDLFNPGTNYRVAFVETGLTTDAALPSTAPTVTTTVVRYGVWVGLRAS